MKEIYLEFEWENEMDDPYDLILGEAINQWGADVQMQMAVGEIGELLTMFARRVQGRDTIDEWIDEIADVTIMMRQLAIIFGVDLVDKRVAYKLEKLGKRLGVLNENE